MARTPQGTYIVVDVIAGRWSANNRNAQIRQTAATDQQTYGRVKTVIEQAPGLAKEPTDDIVRQLAGYVVAADKVNKDKESRAEPVQAQSEAGNVQILAGKWNSAWLDELCEFPTGKHDDQVDPFSGAFNQLAAVVMVQEDSDPFGGYRG
jgi:predicted phage terminase large subunit-like protein